MTSATDARTEQVTSFRAVVEATDDGLLVVDEGGLVLFANRAASALLGRTPGQLDRLPFGLPLVDERGHAELDVVVAGGLLVVEMHVAPIRWLDEPAQVITLRDVTDRVVALRRLRQSEDRYALSAAAVNDGLWEWDVGRSVVHASARLLDMLGFPAEERDDDVDWWRDRIHLDDKPALADAVRGHLQGDLDRISREVRLLSRDGSWVWTLVRGLAVVEGDRGVRVAGSVTDIRERKEAEGALRRLALHDPLTGLANRVVVLDRLQTAIEHTRRSPEASYAVVFMDLDQFKLVNDSLGHSAGDALLVEVARRLTSCVRVTDTVGRLGGDEFVILLEAPTDREHTLATVRRIRDRLAAPIRIGAELVYMTASLGVLLGSAAPDDAETVLRNADVAMYEAKLHGRDGFAVFTERMQAATAQRLVLRTALRTAVATSSLLVHYQPVVMLGTGRIVGFEALLRWRTGDGVVLDAEAFIDTAEETGVIVAAGWNALTDACRQVGRWRASGFPVQVAVNLAAGQVNAPDLVDRVRQALADSDVDGSALQLEITERVAMTGLPGALDALEACRGMGVEVLVDDFGTGYSSLTALHDLPVSAIKIDKSFVSRLDGHHDDVVVAILALARSLGLGVIAEGIETSAQLARLRELGCDCGQGFLYAPAVDAEQATRLLRSQERGD